MMCYEEKIALLEKNLSGYDHLVVAFSGGVDSTFLLLYGKKVLGSHVTALTASAPNFAPDEIAYSRELCKKEKIEHIVVDLGAKILDSFSHNPPDRCYICKKAIFSSMMETAGSLYPAAVVADGTNLDDMQDYRPGHKALKELGICSPIKDAGLTKQEIRRGLKELGAKVWNKPAFACLASRIPYGETISVEKLTAIYKVEKALKDLGFEQVRVRHHGDLARIEVDPAERYRFFDAQFMDQVQVLIQNAGFTYATLDLGGYRMGSLNQGIPE